MNKKKASEEEMQERDSAGNYVSVQGNPIREAGNSYILLCGEKKPKEIASFVMEPINAIKGNNAYLIDIKFKLQNGQELVERIDSSAFVSVQKFKAAIKKIGGIEMRFSGNEQNLDDMQKYMENKYRTFNHCVGLDCVGLHQDKSEWVYVGTDGAINKKGKPIATMISILEDNKALDSGIIQADIITKKELSDLSSVLFKFNTMERTVNIIGWICGCFLKERLRQRRIKYPHLVMAGVAGSGKSETLEKVVQPIFCLSGSGIGCRGVTSFSMLKSTSSTNLLPIIYEEYKPHQLTQAETTAIANMLRHTYDGQTTQKGRADQSIINYVRRSPVIVVGESSFDEPAIKQRIIDVQFAESDRTSEHTKAFCSIAKKEKELNGLGKALLLLALNMPDEDLDNLIKESRQFEGYDLDPRVILSMSNVYLGILFLKILYESYHLDFFSSTGLEDKAVRQAITGSTINAIGGTGKTQSAIDLIIQKMDVMASKGRIRNEYDYIVSPERNELQLNVRAIYDEFTKYIREFNITDVEVLTYNQFTKQLRKERYFMDYGVRTFKKSTPDGDKRVRAKCFIINLSLINKICDLDVFCSDIETDQDGFMIPPEEDQEAIPFA